MSLIVIVCHPRTVELEEILNSHLLWDSLYAHTISDNCLIEVIFNNPTVKREEEALNKSIRPVS